MNKMRYFSWGKNKFLAFVLIIAFCFFSMLSCKTTRKIVRSPLVFKNVQELAQLSNDHEFKFDWINAKLTATIVTKDKNASFNINLRLRKDSAIWMSISPALGIEVARILILKDSIKVIDRINSKYIITNYAYLNDLLQVSVDFDMVQSLLVGNNFSYLDDKKFRSSTIDGDLYVLSTLGKRKLKKVIVEDKEINRGIIQDIWLDPESFKVEKMMIQDKKSNKKLVGQYKDFRDIEGHQFPFVASFDVESNKSVQISIEYSKVTINKAQDFPFSIPEKYEKM